MNNLKRVTVCMAACLLSIALGSARAQAADFAPFEGGERLVYRLLWPSGIPMGEAVFEVSSQGDELHFQATVEVRLPQYRFNSMFLCRGCAGGTLLAPVPPETRRGVTKFGRVHGV